MFRRRRAGEDADASDEPADDAPVPTTPAATAGGPWDAGAEPPERPRVDLGALQVPVPERIEMRLDVQDQVVVAVTLIDGHSALQVHAFAAPKTSAIWDEVRAEIAESIRSSGGQVSDAGGPLGPELTARVHAEGPGQPPGLQPIRFIGVDGPRWFLRGVFSGAAATDPAQGRRLLDVFRDIVVVRGGEAMAPRELLPLRLPKEAVTAEPPSAEPARPGLEMLERGPEITETR